MRNNLAAPGRELARNALISQCIAALLIVFIIATTSSVEVLKSVALGATISIIPACVFALFAFRFAGASKNHLVNKSFSQGAKMKLVLTTILFVVAFAGFHAQPVWLFAAYVATTASHALALFWLGTK